MTKYEEGLSILEEKFGKGKDNIISLATISLEKSPDGDPMPCVREVDAYYENEAFYVVTYGKSNKVKQIEANPQVAVTASLADFYASGRGENLGWVLDPKNTEIREKLRSVFKDWYDFANDESDENCCFLAVYLKKGILRINHGEKFYHFDFENKIAE